MRALKKVARAAVLLPLCAAPVQAQQVVWQAEMPRVMVFLDEEGPAASGVLTRFLADAGFDVIDPAFARTVAQQEQATRALAGDAVAATALGRDLGAQVLILGAAPAEAAPSPADPTLQVATADLSVRALRLDRPQLISAANARGRALDATATGARTQALRKASEELLYRTSFLGDVMTNWEERRWDDRAYWADAPPSAPTLTLATAPAGAEDLPAGSLELAIVESGQLASGDAGTRGIGIVARPAAEGGGSGNGGSGASASGAFRVRGIVSDARATVKVAGSPAEVRAPSPVERERYGMKGADAFFEATVPLPPGQDTLRVTARQGGAETGQLIRPRVGRQWAVVIGVSKYADPRITALRYADADARAVHDFLRTPAGGAVAESRIRLLLNEQATAAAIREALFVFLQDAAPEDQVTVYVASHGSPDPRRSANLYILPYDTDADAVAATAFPMWDFKTALRRQIAAERVVVIADACHSGGALVEQANPIGGAFAELFNPSRRVTLSAAAANESSLEGEQWGGGHGAFTHALLEGLRGSADQDGDGVVTFSEAAHFVERRVPVATDKRQHPQRAGRGDLVLGLVGAGS